MFLELVSLFQVVLSGVFIGDASSVVLADPAYYPHELLPFISGCFMFIVVSHGVFANLSVNKSGVVTSVNCLSVKITQFCLRSPAVPYGVSKFRPLFGNLNVLALFYVSLFYVLYSSAALHPPPPPPPPR